MCNPNGDTVSYVSQNDQNTERMVEMPAHERTIPTFAYGYDTPDRRPTVIVLHDVYGASQFYRDLSRRLADEGFAALLPDLFCRQGALPDGAMAMEAVFARASRHSFPTALEDIAAMADSLREEGRQVAVLGFCMGGTLAMLEAGRVATLKAGVIYYGFPVNANPTSNRPDNPYDEVQNLQVPLLGFFGAKDSGVGPENVKIYQQAAKKAGKNVNFTIYPNVGHGFLTFDPAAPTAKASQDSWTRTLAFLKKNLGLEATS